MKYFVNAPAKRSRRRKSGKRRSPAQKRATAKMRAALAAKRRGSSGKAKKRRTTRRSAPVAKRRSRKRSTARRSSTRRRRSTAVGKRRSPVTRLRRGRVYVTNPRKRRRRGGYRRNPNIIRQTTQMVKDTGAVLAGSALGGVASGFLPDLGNPIANAAKGVLVAIGVRMAAARFLGADTARFAAAGAMQVPLKNLVIGFLPADQQVRARALLGDYGDLGAYAALASGGGVGDEQDLGAYTQEMYQQ
jgi:hypothetical protein